MAMTSRDWRPIWKQGLPIFPARERNAKNFSRQNHGAVNPSFLLPGHDCPPRSGWSGLADGRRDAERGPRSAVTRHASSQPFTPLISARTRFGRARLPWLHGQPTTSCTMDRYLIISGEQRVLDDRCRLAAACSYPHLLNF